MQRESANRRNGGAKTTVEETMGETRNRKEGLQPDSFQFLGVLSSARRFTGSPILISEILGIVVGPLPAQAAMKRIETTGFEYFVRWAGQ